MNIKVKGNNNPISAVLGGFILIVVSIVLLWWNEQNNVKNIKTTNEASKTMIQVSSESVDSANEGKLVATNGKVSVSETLSDKTFGVSVVTPKLIRVVEMYQWEEEEDTNSNDETTYKYSKVWSDELIDSTSFNDSGHDNPTTMPYKSDNFYANGVKVGAFSLSSAQISGLSTGAQYTDLSTDVATKLNYFIVDKYYASSEKINSSPVVGDVRVSFLYNNSTDLSVLAKQTGNSFTDYTSNVGKTINRVEDGVLTGEDLINNIVNENNIFKWILRALGVILCIAGIASILSPISKLGKVIPIFGTVLTGMVGIVSLLLGLSISFIVIGVAWLVYRPVVGIIMLCIVCVLIFLLIKKVKSKKTQNPTITSNMPKQEGTFVQPIKPLESTYVSNIDNNIVAPTIDNNVSTSDLNTIPQNYNPNEISNVSPSILPASESNNQVSENVNLNAPIDNNLGNQTSETVVNNNQNIEVVDFNSNNNPPTNV